MTEMSLTKTNIINFSLTNGNIEMSGFVLFFATTMHGIKLYCNYELQNMTRSVTIMIWVIISFCREEKPVKQLWASQNLVKENMRRFVLEKQY